MKPQKKFKKVIKRFRKFLNSPLGGFIYEVFVNVIANLIAGLILLWLIP